MSFFQPRYKQVTVGDLIDRYANILERGPRSGNLHPIEELPAEKSLMKAALVARAFELGPDSLDTLKAAFVALANFQSDAREPASKHAEVLAEMTVLAMEWAARTKSISEKAE